MRETITRCNGPNCGKVKGQANKWIEAWVRYTQNKTFDKLIPIAIMVGELEKEFVRILGDSDDDDYQREDFCSDACLHVRINQVLDAVRQESSAGEQVVDPSKNPLGWEKSAMRNTIDTSKLCLCGGVGCNRCEPQGRG